MLSSERGVARTSTEHGLPARENLPGHGSSCSRGLGVKGDRTAGKWGEGSFGNHAITGWAAAMDSSVKDTWLPRSEVRARHGGAAPSDGAKPVR